METMNKTTLHPLAAMVQANKRGEKTGMFSVCSANAYVLRAAVRYAKKHSCTLIIEATSNQVNQNGGYTGMVPQEFADLVHGIMDQEQVDPNLIILGGDHLGPIAWKNEPEAVAMKGAEEMVRAYTLAGFTKIHIDTSMRLGDDDSTKPLDTQVSANRGARLAKVVQEAYAQRKAAHPEAMRPALIIGSEVPVPGGSTEHEDSVKPTAPEEFRRQVACFQKAFAENGLDFSDVVAFVVQPGVEFGDDFVCMYDCKAAKPLTDALKDYPGFAFEGHSSDYQTRYALRELVEDGVAILKVGPALTFALREALVSLEEIEQMEIPGKNLSHFSAVLKNVLDNDDRYWKAYYFGTPAEVEFKKLYSFSDRCRYYLPNHEVSTAIKKLISNLSEPIAPAYISQFFPELFEQWQCGQVGSGAEDLILGRIGAVLDRYAYGCGENT